VTARDYFTAKLRCLYCGHEADVHLSQADGWSYLNNTRTKIEKMPDGFVGINRGRISDNLAFTCTVCTAPADCT
jgi:hypothetical protein